MKACYEGVQKRAEAKHVTNWEYIRRVSCAGHRAFPGKWVYLFCSLEQLDDPDGSWMRRFRAEAETVGMAVEVHDKYVFVTMPEDMPPVDLN